MARKLQYLLLAVLIVTLSVYSAYAAFADKPANPPGKPPEEPPTQPVGLTLGNFIGFETSGLEEAANIPDMAFFNNTAIRSGEDSLAFGQFGTKDYDIDPFVNGDAGEGYITGFGYRFSNNFSQSPDIIFIAGNLSIRHNHDTDGTLTLINSGVGGSDPSNTTLEASRWYYLEVYFDSAGAKLYIDGVQEIDFVTSLNTSHTIQRLDCFCVQRVVHFDDFYTFSGAAEADILRGPEVYSYQLSTGSSEFASPLDTGTWADTGDTPTNEATTAGLTASSITAMAVADGSVRAGPSGDPNLSGEVLAGKWIYRLQHGTGGCQGEHSVLFGKNGDIIDTDDRVVSLTTSFDNYFVLSEDLTLVPAVDEFFHAGIAITTCNQDMEAAEIWMMALHIPGASYAYWQ